eukprot:gene176-86_t
MDPFASPRRFGGQSAQLPHAVSASAGGTSSEAHANPVERHLFFRSRKRAFHPEHWALSLDELLKSEEQTFCALFADKDASLFVALVLCVEGQLFDDPTGAADVAELGSSSSEGDSSADENANDEALKRGGAGGSTWDPQEGESGAARTEKKLSRKVSERRRRRTLQRLEEARRTRASAEKLWGLLIDVLHSVDAVLDDAAVYSRLRAVAEREVFSERFSRCATGTFRRDSTVVPAAKARRSLHEMDAIRESSEPAAVESPKKTKTPSEIARLGSGVAGDRAARPSQKASDAGFAYDLYEAFHPESSLFFRFFEEFWNRGAESSEWVAQYLLPTTLEFVEGLLAIAESCDGGELSSAGEAGTTGTAAAGTAATKVSGSVGRAFAVVTKASQSRLLAEEVVEAFVRYWVASPRCVRVLGMVSEAVGSALRDGAAVHGTVSGRAGPAGRSAGAVLDVLDASQGSAADDGATSRDACLASGGSSSRRAAGHAQAPSTDVALRLVAHWLGACLEQQVELALERLAQLAKRGPSGGSEVPPRGHDRVDIDAPRRDERGSDAPRADGDAAGESHGLRGSRPVARAEAGAGAADLQGDLLRPGDSGAEPNLRTRVGFATQVMRVHVHRVRALLDRVAYPRGFPDGPAGRVAQSRRGAGRGLGGDLRAGSSVEVAGDEDVFPGYRSVAYKDAATMNAGLDVCDAALRDWLRGQVLAEGGAFGATHTRGEKSGSTSDGFAGAPLTAQLSLASAFTGPLGDPGATREGLAVEAERMVALGAGGAGIGWDTGLGGWRPGGEAPREYDSLFGGSDGAGGGGGHGPVGGLRIHAGNAPLVSGPKVLDRDNREGGRTASLEELQTLFHSAKERGVIRKIVAFLRAYGGAALARDMIDAPDEDDRHGTTPKFQQKFEFPRIPKTSAILSSADNAAEANLAIHLPVQEGLLDCFSSVFVRHLNTIAQVSIDRVRFLYSLRNARWQRAAHPDEYLFYYTPGEGETKPSRARSLRGASFRESSAGKSEEVGRRLAQTERERSGPISVSLPFAVHHCRWSAVGLQHSGGSSGGGVSAIPNNVTPVATELTFTRLLADPYSRAAWDDDMVDFRVVEVVESDDFVHSICYAAWRSPPALSSREERGTFGTSALTLPAVRDACVCLTAWRNSLGYAPWDECSSGAWGIQGVQAVSGESPSKKSGGGSEKNHHSAHSAAERNLRRATQLFQDAVVFVCFSVARPDVPPVPGRTRVQVVADDWLLLPAAGSLTRVRKVVDPSPAAARGGTGASARQSFMELADDELFGAAAAEAPLFVDGTGHERAPKGRNDVAQTLEQVRRASLRLYTESDPDARLGIHLVRELVDNMGE